ncbi:sensor histidine kinase, partial [Streptomyces griseus]|nr:sensor histidine kinase [Streptomyces griseus]
GLRVRLGALGGSLTAGAVGNDDDLFRVTATVPLTAPRPAADGRPAPPPGPSPAPSALPEER